MAPDTSDGPRERRFSYWLGDTLRQAREASAIPRETLAGALGVSSKKLERFERDEGKAGFGRDVDRVVAAYAYALGLEDPRELWKQALERWLKEGPPPDFDGDPGARFVRAIREEARAHAPARYARQRTPAATPRSRDRGE